MRQFVALPLGRGTTVEGQLTGKEELGGIQIRVYEPKPGRFPDRPPPEEEMPVGPLRSPALGLGAGGAVRQKIYPDPYGIDAWDPEGVETLFVHLVNSAEYRELTGREPPPTPIDAATYTERGFPWFKLYDEEKADVPASRRLAGLAGTGEEE